MRIYNTPENIGVRRRLRREAPPAEVILWSKIRGSQVAAAKFRRQHSIRNFVLDFYCTEVKLAIELDGPSHDDCSEYDVQRQRAIEDLGVTFLRFTNEQVHKQLGAVIENISLRVEELRLKSLEG